MRVIAGEARGRRLTGIRSAAIRPTSDRVREALFSTLGAAVAGARVLDLYAGSGALGIEALSRGAARAVFVDSDRKAVEAIRANLALTRMEDRASVVRSPVASFLAAGRHGPFDLVLLDPPYAQGPPVADLEALVGGDLLAAGAWVVLETGGPDAPAPVGGPGGSSSPPERSGGVQAANPPWLVGRSGGAGHEWKSTPGLEVVSLRRYGDTTLVFLQPES